MENNYFFCLATSLAFCGFMFLGFLRLDQFNNWPRLPSIRHATIRFLRFFFFVFLVSLRNRWRRNSIRKKKTWFAWNCWLLFHRISSPSIIHHGLRPDGVPATINRSNDWPAGRSVAAGVYYCLKKEILRLRILYSFCCGSTEVLTDANWDLGVILFSGLFLVDRDNDVQLSKTKTIWWLTLIILSA